MRRQTILIVSLFIESSIEKGKLPSQSLLQPAFFIVFPQPQPRAARKAACLLLAVIKKSCDSTADIASMKWLRKEPC